MNRRRRIPAQKGKVYHCKTSPLTGHKFADIMPRIRQIFRALQRQTKRRPYVRSAYFKKDKIFFDYFWTHLNQKPIHDRARRLRYFNCALELMAKSRNSPKTFMIVTQPGVIHYQFIGIASDLSKFSVVIRQENTSGKKYFLSLFPIAE